MASELDVTIQHSADKTDSNIKVDSQSQIAVCFLNIFCY